MKDAPCKGCKYRQLYCPSRCTPYLQWKDEVDKIHALELEARAAEADVTSYLVQVSETIKKSKRCK